MKIGLKRETFLLAMAFASLWFASSSVAVSDAQERDDSPTRLARNQLRALERKFDGRLGVFVLDTTDGTTLSNRATERFPLCSTFKVLVASAILKRSQQQPDLLQKRIRYQPSQLVDYSPITQKHVA